MQAETLLSKHLPVASQQSTIEKTEQYLTYVQS